MTDINLTVSEHEFEQIVEGLRYAGEDYAYRAEFASKREIDDEEDASYQDDADALFDLAAELERRRDS